VNSNMQGAVQRLRTLEQLHTPGPGAQLPDAAPAWHRSVQYRNARVAVARSLISATLRTIG
jgi:hypothetical protein